MADEPPAAHDEVVVVTHRRRPLAWRIARWLLIAVLALLVVAFAAVAWLNTSSGRQFVVGRSPGSRPLRA